MRPELLKVLQSFDVDWEIFEERNPSGMLTGPVLRTKAPKPEEMIRAVDLWFYDNVPAPCYAPLKWEELK